ncbi:hypothetical protein ACHQM5_017910 [Ranunculus cassubicifolius]
MGDTSATSNTNTTTSIATASNPTLPPIQIHHLISVKLDDSNYLLWLTQFRPLLKGYELEKYVDGRSTCPPLLLANSTDINPDYSAWEKQDQILLGWLLSSLSESALAHVVGLNTSKEVWESLAPHYSSKARSRVAYLKRELQNMRKGSKTMAEYYRHAKHIANSLTAAGNPISDSDLQQTILAGLYSAYDSIVTVLTATVTDLHMDDFYSNLLAF